MPSVHLNGIDLYYEVRGRGEPFLLIPGLGGDISDYAKVVDGLSQAFQVVGLDNRGSGRSEKPDAPYTIEMMSDDAAALLHSQGLAPAHVLGHSMGGRIALDLALRHPDCVRSLVLVSTSARVPQGTRRRVAFLGAFWRGNPLLQRLDRHPQPYYAFQRQFEASRSYDASSRLSQIAVPTLIVRGARDRLAPLVLVEEMHSRIRGSKMVTLRGGHLLLFMDPAACVRAIMDFSGIVPPPSTPAARSTTG